MWSHILIGQWVDHNWIIIIIIIIIIIYWIITEMVPK